jgi:hypothetical protein
MPAARRFPPPWTIAEYNDACFFVRDDSHPMWQSSGPLGAARSLTLVILARRFRRRFVGHRAHSFQSTP